ncbi:MAG: hypothetical protein JKX91_13230 [Rhizobiaceae bacterium]|nr:hypothetical protein [Rhizobiaceae bacterium]
MQKSTLFLCIYLLISILFRPAIIFAHAQNISAPSNAQTNDQSKIKQGRLVSQTHCTRCHVVGDFNPHGGISSTPSFSLLVNHLDDWEDRFLSFHLRRPHPVIIYFRGEKIDANNPPPNAPVVLEYSDIEAITAFAKTLQKTDPK